MTRETKVGLVVAGSFLCLVGVVVFTKLRDSNSPPPANTPTETEEVVVNNPPTKPSDKVAPAPPDSPPTFPADPPPPDLGPPPAPIEQPSDGVLAGFVVFGAMMASASSQQTIVQEPNRLEFQSLPGTPQSGGLVQTNNTQGGPASELPGTPPPTGLTAPPPPESPPGSLAQGPGLGGTSTLLPPPPDPVGTPSLAPADTTGDRSTGLPRAVGLESPTNLTPMTPGTGSPPPLVDGKPAAASLLQPTTTTGGNPIPSSPDAGSPSTETPVVNVQPIRVEMSNLPDRTSTSPTPLPGTSPGAVIPAATPPITVGGSRPPLRPVSAVQVESFDEEEYRVKAGETFATISSKFYRTEKYAQALFLFNRNHPLASAGVRQEPPLLQPGQPVFIPPTSILEKRHPTAIPDVKPLPATGERSSNASPGSAGANAYAQYRVQPEGEMLWEIAQRTLKNGNRWHEIHKLNPTVRPELRIAGGTLLYLPTDAQP